MRATWRGRGLDARRGTQRHAQLVGILAFFSLGLLHEKLGLKRIS